MTGKFPYPYTQKDGENFIQYCMAENGSFIKAIDVDGEMIGAVGLHLQEDIHKNNAELGYWIAEPFWNKGIVTSAVAEMIEWGFLNLPINRIFARPYGSNNASRRVLEKIGFIKEAHLYRNLIKWDEVDDELIYGIRNEEV